MTVLLREAIGDRLRHARTNQRRTLREVSRAARVSLGYLSEVERGRKEASSELLAAICDALELPLAELLNTVASDMSAVEEVQVERVPAPAGGPGSRSGSHRGRLRARAAGWCPPSSATTSPTCGCSRCSATASTPRSTGPVRVYAA